MINTQDLVRVADTRFIAHFLSTKCNASSALQMRSTCTTNNTSAEAKRCIPSPLHTCQGQFEHSVQICKVSFYSLCIERTASRQTSGEQVEPTSFPISFIKRAPNEFVSAKLQRRPPARGALGVLILLSCVLVVGGVLSISNANKQLNSIVKVNVEKTRIGNGMVDANSSILIAMGTLAMVTIPELNPPAMAEIKASRLRYEEFRKQLNKFPAESKSTVQLRADIDAAQGAAHKIDDEVIALGMANRNAEAQTLLSERARPAIHQYGSTIQNRAIRSKHCSSRGYAKPSPTCSPTAASCLQANSVKWKRRSCQINELARILNPSMRPPHSGHEENSRKTR